MKLLAHLVHESLSSIQPEQRVLKREAARGIVLRDDKILLLYTERYDDFSFPGGGIDEGEDPIAGLHRELAEETGASDIEVLEHYGTVTEYLPTWKADWDLMHQTSHWYQCQIGQTLGATRLEHYEIANGMSADWIRIDEALRHNRSILKNRPSSMGLSIHRETLVLERVANELVAERTQTTGAMI